MKLKSLLLPTIGILILAIAYFFVSHDILFEVVSGIILASAGGILVVFGVDRVSEENRKYLVRIGYWFIVLVLVLMMLFIGREVTSGTLPFAITTTVILVTASLVGEFIFIAYLYTYDKSRNWTSERNSPGSYRFFLTAGSIILTLVLVYVGYISHPQFATLIVYEYPVNPELAEVFGVYIGLLPIAGEYLVHGIRELYR